MLETRVDAPLTPSSTLGPHRAADYARLPDEPRVELVYGRLYRMASPLLSHQLVLGELFGQLRRMAADKGAIVVMAPMDVTLADHSVVQPDLLLVTPARKAILRARVEGAPDLLVEIHSSTTARRDRGEKLRLYGESGVREYWMVDPDARSVDFLVRRGDRWLVALAEDGRYTSEAIDGLSLDLGALWAVLDGLRDG